MSESLDNTGGEKPNDPHKNASPEETAKPADKELIPQSVEVILEKLPPNDKRIMEAVLAMPISKRSWAAPMPPPDILSEYNDSFPGGAEAIFKMAKDQSDHRMIMEKTIMNREMNQSGAGQILAFVIAMSFLIVAGYLIYLGHEIGGTIFGTIDLIGLVTVFILGRSGMDRSNNGKQKAD